MAKTSSRALHVHILLLLAATGMAVAILSLSPSPAGSQAFRCGLAGASSLGLATGRTWDFGSQACVDADGTCSSDAPPPRQTPTKLLPVSVASVREALPEPAPARPCGRVSLTQKLGWICAASWAPCPARLIVSTAARPYLVAPDGRVTAFARTVFGNEADDLPPSSIETLNGNLLLSFSNRHAVLLDPSLKQQIATGTLRGSVGREAALGQLTTSALFHDTLFGWGAFSPLEPEGASPVYGFVAATIQEDPLGLSAVRPIMTAKQDYYMLGLHYAAANALGVFFVTMDTSAALYWYQPGGAPKRLVNSIPAPYRDVPPLQTQRKGPSEAGRIFHAVESWRMVAGLYGQGRFVYLLTREPEEKRTVWRLHKIDPMENRYLGSVILPTAAHHLTVVPAADRWYLLERGEVGNAGQQITETQVEIAAPWITDPGTSPLSHGPVPAGVCPNLQEAVHFGGAGRPGARPEMAQRLVAR